MSSARMVVVSCLLVVLVLLAACGPAPETVVVSETHVSAEIEVGTGTVVAVEQVVTATAEPTEPAPTETAPASVADPEREGLWYPCDDPETLDYRGNYPDEAENTFQQCIEGLLEYRGDGSIELAGAAGLDVSDDGRVYTIRLREDAVWSDGEPVVAQHYVDFFFQAEDPGKAAWEPILIEGLMAYITGEVEDPATVGVRAVDDHTLEIRLTEPAAYFETILAWYWYPIRLDLIKAHGDAWTELDNYVCNGAYLLDDWVRGERVVLVKNPDYWNADQVAIERVTLPNSPDHLTLYENDELHVISEDFDWAAEAEYVLSNPVLRQEFLVVPAPGIKYIGLNTLRPPTDDVRVRKALALAIDQEAFLEEMIWSPAWQPTSCTIPPSIMGHQPQGACGHEHDPEQARALLAKAGYPDGEGFPPLHLWVSWQGWHEDALRTVSAMWQETLAITTELHTIDSETFIDYLDECNRDREALAACELNGQLLGWGMDYGDPHNTLETLFAPDSDLHITGWQNERYEELLTLARTEYDTAQRVEYYKEADKILVEEQAVILPLLYVQRPALIKEGLTFEFPPFGPTLFKYWDLP